MQPLVLCIIIYLGRHVLGCQYKMFPYKVSIDRYIIPTTKIMTAYQFFLKKQRLNYSCSHYCHIQFNFLMSLFVLNFITSGSILTVRA